MIISHLEAAATAQLVWASHASWLWAIWLLYTLDTAGLVWFCTTQAWPFNCPCTTCVFRFGLLSVLSAASTNQPANSDAPTLSNTWFVCKWLFGLG